MSKELAKTYDPKGIEDRLYKKWMDNGYFHAKVNPDKKPFTIVMPPPNVTGQLHMGHALDETMQDILIRFKRMQGYEALWQPGTDHAAIATEVKVTEKLRKEGIDKNEIGREEFMKHAWAWKEEYGGKIINQLKKLGASADWERDYAADYDEKTLKEWEPDSNGPKVIFLTDEEKAALREAVQPVYDKYASAIGQDLIDAVAAAEPKN